MVYQAHYPVIQNGDNKFSTFENDRRITGNGADTDFKDLRSEVVKHARKNNIIF